MPMNLAGKIMLQAFTGSGLVASIVSHHLINKLNFMEVGYVKSSLIPSIGLVRNGVIQRPVRIFESSKYVLLLSEISIPQDNLEPLIENLVGWYIEQDIANVVVLGALPTGRKIDASDITITAASSDSRTVEYLKSKGVYINSSAIYGSVAITLLEASECDLSAYAILPNCIASLPDYQASIILIETLNKLLDENIPISPLENSAAELKEHLMRREAEKKSKGGYDEYEDDFVDEFDEDEDLDDLDEYDKFV